MWGLLRDRRLNGIKFRRQVAIGRYVADFACYEAAIVIELDGSRHLDSVRDKLRDADLARRGFEVLRFWNADLFLQRDGVVDAILAAVARRAGKGDRHADS